MSTKYPLEIPYSQDSSSLFEKIADLPWPVFLDSCKPYNAQGRFDIISAGPSTRLTTVSQITEIQRKDGVTTSSADPFDLLQAELKNHPTGRLDDLPFAGGALGYFSYDLARRLEVLPTLSQQDIHLPEMAVGIYDWAIMVDHQQQRAWLTTHHQGNLADTICQPILERLQQPLIPSTTTPFALLQPFHSNFDQAGYAQAFHKIQQHLRKGDCYQVNLAQRFSSTVRGSPWQTYKILRQHNPSTFAAFIKITHGAILSLSPERFLKVCHDQVETKPIKGTRPRGNNEQHDQQLANELRNDPKELAENLMIVDLLRNDLSKSCEPGSIQVPKLFDLESLASVHHLVSTVTGKLARGKTSLDLLRSCFPGGSVTGAPKLRAMEIIESLEPHRRNIYCGSIGYVDFNGSMDCNIAIRTLLWLEENLYCYAGGAITIDSNVENEYAETMTKIATILNVLTP